MTTLLLGDCLEQMKSLPDKSVDCFICDLPYGQFTSPKLPSGDALRFAETRCAWDVKLNLEQFWTQIKRLCKNDHTPVLMFCNTKFGFDLYNSNPTWFRYDLVWDKGRGVSFLSANKMPMKSHEMLYVFSKKGAFYRRIDIKGNYTGWAANKSDKEWDTTRTYGTAKNWIAHENDGTTRCALSVINQTRGGHNKNTHPTEKPMELYEFLLRRYVPDNGLVLDPTAGSFNSILVAKRLGYRAIGIEKDIGFFWKGVSKLKDS